MEETRSLVIRASAPDGQADEKLAAFGQLVQRFWTMACGYAYSILGDFHLAEDASQDAFIQAYRKLGDLREPAAFPGWLRRIVFKQCDRITRGKPGRPRSLPHGTHEPSREPDPAHEAQRQEMAQKVLAAICSLPARERTVATLFYVNGYSQRTIAEFLEVPVSTVNSRLHASRKRLRKKMAKDAANEEISRRIVENMDAADW